LSKGEDKLSSKFIKRWEERDGSRIKAALKPTPSLRAKIQVATRRIEAQVQYLGSTLNSLAERDKYLFSKVVESYQKNQRQRANIFANELAELRKMANFLMSGQLALERVVLRLSTVTQMGNVMSALAPATSVLQNVKSGIAGILPNAEKEIGDISMLLNDIIAEAGQSSGIAPDFDVASEEARSILAEAAIVTEQKMKEKFPELPSLAQPQGAQDDFGQS
jgi:division protein CdvB (Snf7/Vps24/ESCRT-III family)